MANLDPRIEAVREQYGLAKDDFWQIPQNKQWVCKHAALEVVATKANVEWALPQVIQADTGNGIAVMVASGKMGNRVEWATGEASPKNNKNGYPWAMAEKRAKDRVVLKLVGIHGLVYSEDEADDFKAPARTNEPPQQKSDSTEKKASSAEQKRQLSEIEKDLVDVHSEVDIQRCADIWQTIATRDGWSRDYRMEAKKRFDAKREEISKRDVVADIADTFPGSRTVDERITDREASQHPLNS